MILPTCRRAERFGESHLPRRAGIVAALTHLFFRPIPQAARADWIRFKLLTVMFVLSRGELKLTIVAGRTADRDLPSHRSAFHR